MKRYIFMTALGLCHSAGKSTQSNNPNSCEARYLSASILRQDFGMARQLI